MIAARHHELVERRHELFECHLAPPPNPLGFSDLEDLEVGEHLLDPHHELLVRLVHDLNVIDQDHPARHQLVREERDRYPHRLGIMGSVDEGEGVAVEHLLLAVAVDGHPIAEAIEELGILEREVDEVDAVLGRPPVQVGKSDRPHRVAVAVELLEGCGLISPHHLPECYSIGVGNVAIGVD